MNKLSFRYAEKEDIALILKFIIDLAKYEKLENEVVATAELIEEWIFERKEAEVIFAVIDGNEIGFALFFHSFSTFLSRASIYLEDLYIKPEYRGYGYGKALIVKLAQIALEQKCGRLEWRCLNSNKSGIDFYRSLGAEAMDEWTLFRIDGETLEKLGS